MRGAGGAMTQTFYRLFDYALLDNEIDDQKAIVQVNYHINCRYHGCDVTNRRPS